MTALQHVAGQNWSQSVDLGELLRGLRHNSERTLRQAAKKIGCDHTWLSKVENNHALPGWETLKKMAEVFDAKRYLGMFAFIHLARTHAEELEAALSVFPKP